MTEDSAINNIELIDIHPVEESASGKNAFYHFCHNRQQQVSYAVCLHTIRAINDNRLPKDQFTDCQRGYHRNDCYAKKMLEEEKAAGQALYFTPRKIFTGKIKEAASEGAVSSGKYDMNDPSYARGWAIGGGSGEVSGKKPKNKIVKPPVPVKPKTAYIEASMADVLNVISADEKSKTAAAKVEPVEVKTEQAEVKKVSPTAIRPNKGESMADFIQRRAKESKAK